MGVEGWVSKAQLENRPETTQVTMQTAKELFTELAGATFETSSGVQSPIPFHYPVDGCYDRAHVMAQLLTEKGYASEKVFAISRKSGGKPGLRVPTDYADDNMSAGQQPAVQWWYHVAPIIKVQNNKGQVAEMVIDPSMTNQPITIDQWTGMMSSETFNRMTVPDIQKLLQQNSNNYPKNQNLTYTTDRNVYYPLSAIDSANPTKAEAEAKHTANLPRIENYGELAKLHESAAAIRRELRATPININNIVNIINTANPDFRMGLRTPKTPMNQERNFSVLYQEIRNALPNPGDMNRVENAVNKP